MPRFVVLEHDHPELHWDLMLEAGGFLQTWRLTGAPEHSACPIEATEIADHRLMFLDYEGPVSGNRGAVRRWDAGTFAEEADSLPDLRRFFLEGNRIRGQVRLERGEAGRWRFLWLPE